MSKQLWGLVALLSFGSFLAGPVHAVCTGDCRQVNVVSTTDLVLTVGIALEQEPLSACPAASGDGKTVTVGNIVQAVGYSLHGCPATPTATTGGMQPTDTPTLPAATDTPTPTVTVPPTQTATETPTIGGTATATHTVAQAATATATPEATNTVPLGATATATVTPTATTSGPGCGNNVVEGNEQCDGTAHGSCPEGATCFPPGDPNECQCKPVSCAAIDGNSSGDHSSGTFKVASAGAPMAGTRYCGGLASANAFGNCMNDFDCGGMASDTGQCATAPWLGVATFAPFPITSVQTTFTAGPPDAKCVHQATVPCVGSTDPCPGTPKLGTGNPCCTTAGFKVDTFFIGALGFCSRVDQTACGGGIVDTSIPMLGDNDVAKVADTTTPTGPNCTYTAGDVHPACGQTEDKLGQITTTIGNGMVDANGAHTRLSIPQRSVTWIEISAPPCGPTDTFDGNDAPITAFNLNLATTTASATAKYQDVSGDGVAFCGFGPEHFNAIAKGKPDLPGQGSLTVAVGTALSGGGPTYDLLFSSITPLTSPVLVDPVAMCEPPAAGCPE